jgi:hypothetical protein
MPRYRSVVTSLTSRLADPNNPASLSSKARARRWDRFVSAFPSLAEMKVLDLGGTPAFWESAPVRAAHVTIVNISAAPADEPDWLRYVQGDACDPPVSERFDLVVSNSLLEHVGGHYRRMQVADVVHRSADHHWVQTPYRYFPVEPHWVAPAMQWLPVAARAQMSRRWPLGHMRPTERRPVMDGVLEVELLSIAEMRYYFPDSEIWRERFAGLVKSLTAIR